MASPTKAQGVHLVGSVPYATTEETFTQLSKALPGRLRRIPDGEPGSRGYWTWWLHTIFPDWALNPLSYPAKLAVGRGEPDPGPPFWFASMQPPPARKDGEQMTILKPAYAEAAKSSYAVFKKLRDEGVIEPGVRFQVSIPTAGAIICSHISTPFRAEVDAALEPQILALLKEVQEAIPAEDLAIQIDLAAEMGYLENETDRSPDLWFAWFEKGKTMSELVPRIQRHIAAVNENVQLGFHFCYGDVGHQHWGQPLDTGLMVSLLNEIKKVSSRSIDFVHLPVPVDRTDEAYFQPLTTADLDLSTELYLGVVRENDAEGTAKRLATAQQVVKRPFGIAAECGLGRIDAAAAQSVLQISSDLAGPV